MSEKSPQKVYVSTHGHNYRDNKTGKERRVEIGEVVVNMNEVAIKNELRDEKIMLKEEWDELHKEEEGGDKQ